MLKLIEGLPENVIGVTGEGKITGKDYETVLIPAVEKKLTEIKKIRIIYHLAESFTGFDVEAMFDDAKIGMKHMFSYEKVAFVSDHDVINTFTKFFGHMIPGEVKVFKNSEFEEAKKWISEN